MTDRGADTAAETRILIADDQIVVRRVLRRMLEKSGYPLILEAEDGEAAIEILRTDSEGFDVIFCDLNMPGRDGVDVIREISASSRKTAIVVMSAADERVIRAAAALALSRGCRVLGSLVKPIGLKAVQELMDARLSQPHSANVSGPVTELSVDEVRGHLEAARVRAFFQPKMDLRTGAVAGAEVLARIVLEDGAVISPARFIGVAERSGLISDLTRQVSRDALRAVGGLSLPSRGFHVAINFSASLLSDLSLPDWLAREIEEAGLVTHNVTIEMTESEISNDPSSLLDVTSRLRLKGFLLSIDDFGTGYSTLEALEALPFTELKIDRSFIRDARRNKVRRSIIEATIEMAGKIGLLTVAEGIETDEDESMVRELGCDTGQGYRYSQPVDGPRFDHWLKARAATAAEA